MRAFVVNWPLDKEIEQVVVQTNESCRKFDNNTVALVYLQNGDNSNYDFLSQFPELNQQQAIQYILSKEDQNIYRDAQ